MPANKGATIPTAGAQHLHQAKPCRPPVRQRPCSGNIDGSDCAAHDVDTGHMGIDSMSVAALKVTYHPESSPGARPTNSLKCGPHGQNRACCGARITCLVHIATTRNLKIAYSRSEGCWHTYCIAYITGLTHSSRSSCQASQSRRTQQSAGVKCFAGFRRRNRGPTSSHVSVTGCRYPEESRHGTRDCTRPGGARAHSANSTYRA
jgi:hypothetical protein